MTRRKKKDDEGEGYEELDFSERRESSIITTLKNLTKRQIKKAPLTFNVGVAIILFFCYLSITFVSLPTAPQLLILLLPTLYIILRYIKLERDSHGKER